MAARLRHRPETGGLHTARMNLRTLFPALLLGLLLAGCGSGSGEGVKAPPPPPPPAPTLQLSATPAELEVGLSAVLRWSSTDADQCSASGGWSGPRSIAGSESVQPAEGRTLYRLSCSGAGGSAEALVEIIGIVTPSPDPTLEAELEFERIRDLEQGCCETP